jgi:hypothetical protein
MNYCSAEISISEELPGYDLIRPKHVAIKCDFNAF